MRRRLGDGVGRVGAVLAGAVLTAAVLAGCGGGSSGRWQLTFSDSFPSTPGQARADADGRFAAGNWHGYPDGTPITNSSGGIYDPSGAVSVGDGVMHFHLFSSQGSGRAAAESPLTPDQTYGKYEIRYRYKDGADTPGFKTVWLLWPGSNHWSDGEIDINEYDNAPSRSTVSASVHQPCATTPCPTQRGAVSADPTQWHTATLVWTPHHVSSAIDGRPILSTGTNVPHTAMRLVLQTEASSFGARAAPGATTDVDVDWVRIYRLR